MKLGLNANEVLINVNKMLKEAEEYKLRYNASKKWKIWGVYSKLNIFDWFVDYLSVTQLKQMKMFLENTIKLGFGGYACFKVGAPYCAHGMWVYKKESETGYSPDGAVIWHSFRNGEDNWDVSLDGNNFEFRCDGKLNDVRNFLKESEVN